MRIPPSAIVMSVVTAVPFGLAIRAGLQHHDRTIDARAEAEQNAQDCEAQQLQEAHEREALKARQRARIDELFGPTPATLGSLFDDAALPHGGGSLPEPIRIEAFSEELHVHIRYEPRLALGKLHIGADDAGLCAAIGDRLDAIWPDGVSADGATIWLDPTTRQRAVFQTDASECAVEITPYAPIDEWFDLSQASIVPVWAIGEPVQQLETALGARAVKSGETITWVAPGPGATTDVTRLVAEIEDHRVVAINAWSSTPAETGDDIARQLANVLGTPVSDDTTRQTWASKPPVELSFEGGVAVRVGRAPKVVP